MGESIDGRAEAWSEKNFADHPEAWEQGFSGKKRRRVDKALAQEMVDDGDRTAAEAARQTKLIKAGTGTARGWLTRWLSDMRASSLLRTKNFCSTLSSSFDAARLGRPAVDYNMHIMWDHADKVLDVAPPKECDGHFLHLSMCFCVKI